MPGLILGKMKSPSSNCIKLGALNCQGLRDKIDLVEIQNLISSCDIFGATETWLGDSDDCFLDGFRYHPLNRGKEKGARRGGIGLFVRNDWKEHVKIRKDLSSEISLWCKLSKKFFGFPEDVYLGIVYIPPAGSSREKKSNLDHFNHLLETTRKIESDHVILMGDFNARTKNLEDILTGEKDEVNMDQVGFFSKVRTQRMNQDPSTNSYGRSLTEYCIATGSYIANGRTIGDLQGKLTCHQHNGSSTVDYAIINETLTDYIQNFRILNPDTGSDHSPIKLNITLRQKLTEEKNDNSKLPPKILWNDVTKQSFEIKINSPSTLNKLNELNNKLSLKSDNVDEVLSELIDLITPESKKKHMTKRSKTKRPPKKWYDHTCQEMSRRLRDVTKLYVKSPTIPHLRNSYCKTRKEYKQLLKLKKQEWRSGMISKLETLEKQHPKEYWKLVNEIRGKKQRETSFSTSNFMKFFENLYSKTAINKSDEEIEKFVTETLEKLQSSSIPDFTLEELIYAIKRLKNNKAAGLDRIPAEIIKACPPHILELLLKIMNKIKCSSIYPKRWGLGITSLLFKEGEDDDPNNYRAITVCDTLSKVFAIMLNERIVKWDKENKIMCHEQIGFEKKTRPSDHLLVLKTLIDVYANSGKKLFACFVDFQKAFDSVWRTMLFYKLIKYGLDLGVVKLLKNMYEKTCISLKLNGYITPLIKTFRGVRQGCNLSPKVFNLMINDIPKLFDKSCDPARLDSVEINCLMYADDLVLLSTSEAGLQECLHRLQVYMENCHLNLNLKKTKIICFHKNGHIPKRIFYFGDQIVEKTTKYKYLGTIVTNTGNFKTNEINLKKKGLRASFLISKISEHAKPSTSIRIYEKVVEPILMYNCEVSLAYIPKSWTYSKFENNMWDVGGDVNKVTLSFLRQLLGVHKKTSNLALLGETGKYPLSVKIFQQIVKYWFRLTYSENTFLQACKRENLSLNLSGRQNWYRMAQYLLKMTNLEDADIRDEKSADKIVQVFIRKIKGKYNEWWNLKMSSVENRKLEFLSQYKKTFKFEQYLDTIPRHIRIHMTRLRTSSHSFPIETKRYVRPRVEPQDRKCNICNTDEIGDEHHYLLKCPNESLVSVRSTFIDNVTSNIPQLMAFNPDDIIRYCLLMHDQRTTLWMAEYVKGILKAYKETTNEKKEETPVYTRCGRLIRKPIKLNL